MDSAFVNLIRGNRLKLHAGIDISKYPEIIYSKDYTYAEFKASKILISTVDKEGNTKIKTSKKAKAGDEIDLVIDCGVVRPEKYKVLIEPTGDLINHFAYMNYQRLMEPSDVGDVLISGKLRSDLDLESLGSAVRIYLMA